MSQSRPNSEAIKKAYQNFLFKPNNEIFEFIRNEIVSQATHSQASKTPPPKVNQDEAPIVFGENGETKVHLVALLHDVYARDPGFFISYKGKGLYNATLYDIAAEVNKQYPDNFVMRTFNQIWASHLIKINTKKSDDYVEKFSTAIKKLDIIILLIDTLLVERSTTLRDQEKIDLLAIKDKALEFTNIPKHTVKNKKTAEDFTKGLVKNANNIHAQFQQLSAQLSAVAAVAPPATPIANDEAPVLAAAAEVVPVVVAIEEQAAEVAEPEIAAAPPAEAADPVVAVDPAAAPIVAVDIVAAQDADDESEEDQDIIVCQARMISLETVTGNTAANIARTDILKKIAAAAVINGNASEEEITKREVVINDYLDKVVQLDERLKECATELAANKQPVEYYTAKSAFITNYLATMYANILTVPEIENKFKRIDAYCNDAEKIMLPQLNGMHLSAAGKVFIAPIYTQIAQSFQLLENGRYQFLQADVMALKTMINKVLTVCELTDKLTKARTKHALANNPHDAFNRQRTTSIDKLLDQASKLFDGITIDDMDVLNEKITAFSDKVSHFSRVDQAVLTSHRLILDIKSRVTTHNGTIQRNGNIAEDMIMLPADFFNSHYTRLAGLYKTKKLPPIDTVTQDISRLIDTMIKVKSKPLNLSVDVVALHNISMISAKAYFNKLKEHCNRLLRSKTPVDYKIANRQLTIAHEHLLALFDITHEEILPGAIHAPWPALPNAMHQELSDLYIAKTNNFKVFNDDDIDAVEKANLSELIRFRAMATAFDTFLTCASGDDNDSTVSAVNSRFTDLMDAAHDLKNANISNTFKQAIDASVVEAKTRFFLNYKAANRLALLNPFSRKHLLFKHVDAICAPIVTPPRTLPTPVKVLIVALVLLTVSAIAATAFVLSGGLAIPAIAATTAAAWFASIGTIPTIATIASALFAGFSLLTGLATLAARKIFGTNKPYTAIELGLDEVSERHHSSSDSVIADVLSARSKAEAVVAPKADADPDVEMSVIYEEEPVLNIRPPVPADTSSDDDSDYRSCSSARGP